MNGGIIMPDHSGRNGGENIEIQAKAVSSTNSFDMVQAALNEPWKEVVKALKEKNKESVEYLKGFYDKLAQANSIQINTEQVNWKEVVKDLNENNSFDPGYLKDLKEINEALAKANPDLTIGQVNKLYNTTNDAFEKKHNGIEHNLKNLKRSKSQKEEQHAKGKLSAEDLKKFLDDTAKKEKEYLEQQRTLEFVYKKIEESVREQYRHAGRYVGYSESDFVEEMINNGKFNKKPGLKKFMDKRLTEQADEDAIGLRLDIDFRDKLRDTTFAREHNDLSANNEMQNLAEVLMKRFEERNYKQESARRALDSLLKHKSIGTPELNTIKEVAKLITQSPDKGGK